MCIHSPVAIILAIYPEVLCCMREQVEEGQDAALISNFVATNNTRIGCLR